MAFSETRNSPAASASGPSWSMMPAVISSESLADVARRVDGPRAVEEVPRRR